MLNNKRNALLFILSFLALAFPMVGTALDRTDISGLASEHVMERLKAIEKIARV